MDTKKLGALIKRLRKKKKLSRQQLAINAGVGIVALTKYEKGEASYGLILLCRIVTGLEMSLSDFFLYLEME